ncbi:GAF domain-containing SpoIIE family protein phosphatase [Haloechinothrix salitolerans]|uniref:GAF domain-containing SpoIIE family protein phosphatase n=1 Tax=Haloechinothrix salitolerans TaxID=926830 RepID=A0ABW2C141_9PSEU
MAQRVGQPGEAEDQLRRIEHITDTALAHVDLEDLLGELLERVRDLLDADSAVILMHDADAGVMVPTAARGLQYDVREAARVPVGSGFAGSVAALKRPLVLDRVDETTVVNPMLWQQGLNSLLGVPMLAEGHVVGVLHVGSVARRPFTEDDIRLLQVAADRIALATQATTNRTERTAAAALQRSLMPSKLPEVPGLALAARYVPGGGASIGGDWYDVFTLPSGRLGLVIGDVVGHGLHAAVIMGRMRSAVRAYALETEEPAVVIEKLDRKMKHFEPGAMATVAYAIVDPSTHQIEVSLAGHPPPVHALPGHPAALLDMPTDLPIGVTLPAKSRRTTRVDLGADGVLCCYTDGLVERSGAPIDDGLDRLCGAINVGTPAEDVCGTIMKELVAGKVPTDDVALVVLCGSGSFNSSRVE